jgi:hypothetical protein
LCWFEISEHFSDDDDTHEGREAGSRPEEVTNPMERYQNTA